MGEFQNGSLWWDFCVTETSVVTRFTIKSTLIRVLKLTFLFWVKNEGRRQTKFMMMAGCVWCSLNTNTESEW